MTGRGPLLFGLLSEKTQAGGQGAGPLSAVRSCPRLSGSALRSVRAVQALVPGSSQRGTAVITEARSPGAGAGLPQETEAGGQSPLHTGCRRLPATRRSTQGQPVLCPSLCPWPSRTPRHPPGLAGSAEVPFLPALPGRHHNFYHSVQFSSAILIPACASSSPAFLMMYSAYKINKQGDNIQP